MIGGLARRILGTANDRIVRELERSVEEINALEPELKQLSDDQIRAKTDEFRARLNSGEALDDLLKEAFATVREASVRTLTERHYDVQLMGGIVLHQGNIAEMKTGEGKTLVSTLAVYLNAIKGLGVHIVTVNDYLARRDSEWMGEIYNFLGLTVGCIVPGLDDEMRRTQYASDVTYGTNNELGFDYLRDNMKYELSTMVQRPFNFAIVDEVDSILVDEARTPLIISGPIEQSSELYKLLDGLIPDLTESDYEIDEKARTVVLSDHGVGRMEELLSSAKLLKGDSLYDIDNISIVHHTNQALRAHKLFEKDRDYIVKDDGVVIIDEFTGRAMEGRRYSEGLHQALESKERVTIQQENQTLASITFQNYFRMYPKLSGMTGTAATEAEEFADIYGLEVVEIPTNMPAIRHDEDDEIYRGRTEKNKAIVERIRECRDAGQPVLVGTVSIEKSEELAKLLDQQKIPHRVLNARYHEQEAHIIAQAGRIGAITIATNMAGRGTDIKLGGNIDMRMTDELDTSLKGEARQKEINRINGEVEEEKKRVIAAGGLAVIGTERHESRRIDNQLRGRSGRQGDPGKTNFYLSLEDDLMRIFGSERMDSMLQKLGLREDEAIVHPWVNKAIQKAQQKVETRNYDIRKNLLKFDDVMNDQRKVIYEQRIDLMEANDISDTVLDMREEVIDRLISESFPENAYSEQWQTEQMRLEVKRIFNLDLPIKDWAAEEGIAEEEIKNRVASSVSQQMAERVSRYGTEVWRMVEKNLTLQVLDQHYKDHLLGLDHLRQGIGLRAYGQRDPLNEYKSEAFAIFENMLVSLRENLTMYLSHIELQLDSDLLANNQPQPEGPGSRSGNFNSNNQTSHPVEAMPTPNRKGTKRSQALAASDPNDPETWGKIGRNHPCPCGSGKKYKQCHGSFR